MKKSILLAFALVGILAYGQQNTTTADKGAVINGVKWATRNVATPGTFVANPEDAGMFYQWNRKVAWPATGDVSNWNTTSPAGTAWEKANDPSPAGWRVPTSDEIETLLESDKVLYERTVVNGVNGGIFTDMATGNSIFLPAAGFRDNGDGSLILADENGDYWSSTQQERYTAYYLNSSSDSPGLLGDYRTYGLLVRPVVEN